MVRIGTTTIDDMGRLLLKSEIRTMLEWEKGDSVNVYYVDNNTAILQIVNEPPENTCTICKNAEMQISFKGVNICQGCAQQINAHSSARLLSLE